MSNQNVKNILWIATVGGAPEPLITSLLFWKPERAIFLPSPETRIQIQDRILPEAQRQGIGLSPGQYDILELPEAQNPTSCVKAMITDLKHQAQTWLDRGEQYRVVIDWTGGTKSMAASLALAAHKWRNTHFSYVGGTERTKGGIGTVQSGKEQVLTSVNTWEALGYGVISDAIYAYNHRAFSSGIDYLSTTLSQISSENQLLKAECNSLLMLMKGTDAWDKCEYRTARGSYQHCSRRLNDFSPVLSRNSFLALSQHVNFALNHLNMLIEDQGKLKSTAHLCHDLLANAGRRREEHRYVDAVARLYHAVEALGQIRLLEYEIDASNARVEDLPASFRERVSPQQSQSGIAKLGLQDVYGVLIALGDPLGQVFQELRWHKQNSPLSRRNRSIAGHGFEPVRPSDCDELWDGALTLAGLEDIGRIKFPVLEAAF